MKNLIKYITLVILLTACTKNSNKEVTVTGRLMQSCDTPAANKNGIIHLSGGGLFNNPSTSLEFTTDENGYFKVTHDKSFSEFSVRTSANHSVLDVTSLGEDEKELGEVYIFHPKTQFYINLSVEKSYTSQDTLRYPDYNSSSGFGWRKVPGPFSNGIIDTVHSMTSTSAMPVKFNSTNDYKATLKYYMNEYVGQEKSTKFPVVHCQEEYQTVTLVID